MNNLHIWFTHIKNGKIEKIKDVINNTLYSNSENNFSEKITKTIELIKSKLEKNDGTVDIFVHL